MLGGVICAAEFHRPVSTVLLSESPRRILARRIPIMSQTAVSRLETVQKTPCFFTRLGRMERELEVQIKESFEESRALRERFQIDLDSIREDAERRLIKHNRHAKKRQTKWKEHVSCVEQDKTDALQHADLLQEQLIASATEVRQARARMFELESEAQDLRARPPQVVERADPETAAEAVRLRNQAAAIEEHARRAHRDAADAREALGRESAVNQSFQREIDNSRHRLLTVQGSLAEALEETVGLKRELEAERIKMAAGSRRLADAVERHDTALAEIRRDSVQLRDQRDSFAQDCAVMGINLHQLKKQKAAGRLLYVLSQARYTSLARALRTWVVWVVDGIHLKRQTRLQKDHASDVLSLEKDLHGAEARCRDARQRNDALRDSRAAVAEAIAIAGRRRGGLAAAAGERGDPALQWCFWGWARLARGGFAARATRARRIEAEKELQGVREMRQALVERARGAETERDRYMASAKALSEEVNQRKAELDIARVALRTTPSLASTARNRSIHLGAARAHKILECSRQDQVAHAFSRWVESRRTSAPRPEKMPVCLAPVTLTAQNADSKQSPAKHQWSVEKTQTKVEVAEASSGTLAASDGLVLSDDLKSQAAARQGSLIVKEQHPQLQPAVETTGERAPGELETLAGSIIIKAPCAVAPETAAVSPLDGDTEGMSKISNSKDCEPQVLASKPLTKDIDAKCKRETANNAGAQASASPGASALPTTMLSDNVAVQLTTHKLSNEEGTPASNGGNWAAQCRSRVEMPVPVSTEVSSAYQPTDDGNTINSCGSAPTGGEADLPRLMLALRTAVGEELYSIGERLFRCVEADHRDIHGKPYHPIPLTGAERDQFHACLEDATCGSLRQAVLAFLQAQELYRAVAIERDRALNQAGQACNGGEGRKNGRRGGGGGSDCDGKRDSKVTPRKAKGARQIEVRGCDVFSLTTGPLSNPAEKARAARVLRDRLTTLLENADEAWAIHRRPWQTLRGGIEVKGLCKRRTSTAKRGEQLRQGNSTAQGWLSSRLPCLDSGGGPRKFWESVAGPKFIEPSWKVDVEALEQQLWELAILVREQDRGQGLALRRCEGLRRVLDLRIYEILLLHVRTRLLWGGIDEQMAPAVELELYHDATP